MRRRLGQREQRVGVGGGLPIGWGDEYDGSGGGHVPSEPRPTGPKWAIDPKTGKPYCDEAARKRIEAAYYWLTQSIDAYRLISTFDGLGACVAKKWRGASAICHDLSIPEMAEKSFQKVDESDLDTRPFTFSTRELATASDEFLGMRVLQQLIWRCGGTLIDAYAIAILLDPGHAYPLDLQIGMDRVRHAAEFVPPNEGGPYYRGKWVIWNYLKGEIYNMNRPGVSIIPSKAWSSRLQNGYRQFWRLP